MADKEGAMVLKDHDECLKVMLSLLEEFGLPTGLLPMAHIIEAGYVKDTGYFWIIQKNKVEYYFKAIGRQVIYDTYITGYVEDKCIKKLMGVKAKEMMIWVTVNEITIFNDQSNGDEKVLFRSFIGITRTFPAEAFQIGN